MPRGPRLDAPGVLHHVMARGIDRQPIFLDDRDRDDFVRRGSTRDVSCACSSLTLFAGRDTVPHSMVMRLPTGDFV